MSAAHRTRPSWLPNQPAGPLHVGWEQLRAAFRGAGIASGLRRRTMHAALGPHARMRPTRAAVVGLLDTYFRGEVRAVDEGRYFSHRDGDRRSARQIVTRLSALLPELAPLRLVTCQDRIELRTLDGSAMLDPEAVENQELRAGASVFFRRTVSVEAIVDAVNELLARRRLAFRFLPVGTPDYVEAYLAVSYRGAAVLDSIGFWEEPLSELLDVSHMPRETRRVA